MIITHLSATVTGRQIPVPTNTSPRAVLVLLILIQQQKSNFQIVIQLIRDQLIHQNQLLNGQSGVLTRYAVLAVAMEQNHDHEHVLLKVNVKDHRLNQLLAMKVIVLVARSISVIGVLISPKNAIPLLRMTILELSLSPQKENVL